MLVPLGSKTSVSHGSEIIFPSSVLGDLFEEPPILGKGENDNLNVLLSDGFVSRIHARWWIYCAVSNTELCGGSQILHDTSRKPLGDTCLHGKSFSCSVFYLKSILFTPRGALLNSCLASRFSLALQVVNDRNWVVWLPIESQIKFRQSIWFSLWLFARCCLFHFKEVKRRISITFKPIWWLLQWWSYSHLKASKLESHQNQAMRTEQLMMCHLDSATRSQNKNRKKRPKSRFLKIDILLSIPEFNFSLTS